MCLVYLELGPAALAGVAVLAVLVPFNAAGSKFGEILQTKQLKAKDSRIKLMNEILAGIKVLKLYAWEIPFIKRILETRRKELQIIKKNAILNSFNNFTYACSPILVTLAAFTAYASVDGNVLTPQKVFVSIAYFNLMRIPLMLFPLTLREVIKTYVSLKRITEFLNAEEIQQDSIQVLDDKDDVVVKIDQASLSWDGGESTILKDLNLSVAKGKLVAIVGTVGAGKSSLLSAILGEMDLEKGKISKHGSVAYVGQQAWIQNLSLRDNVLFGQAFASEKYEEIIQACSLKADLQILVNGDQTEIGENGINLSGGQKQRVNLARAIYADSDIFLLDDPLSAVDSHVGKHIFDHVISNSEESLLKEKTRIWVTNHLTFLPFVDHIVVMENGRILEQGNYRDLIRSKSLNHLVQEEQERRLTERDTNENAMADEVLTKPQENKLESKDEEKGKLIQSEAAETGSVKLTVYLSYFKSLGWLSTLIFIVLVAAQESLHLTGNIWLANWSDTNTVEKDGSTHDTNYYLIGYALIGLSEMVIKLGNDLTYFFKCVKASKTIHKNVLDNIMKSPMRFFDTNPTGRILNRFTSDLDTIDQQIPPEFLDFAWCCIECIVVILLICVTTPAFIAVIIPLLVIYFFIQRIYISSSRQFKRLYSISKSPIFSHFTETINGAQTIRAYGHQERFIQESQDRVRVNVVSVYLNFMSNRWLGLRLEFIGNCIIFSAALFAVLLRDNLSGGQAGLSITSSLQIIGALVWVVRTACQLENDCVSIERVMEYTNTEQEATWENDQTVLKPGWPSKGHIEFKTYQTRYREGLDLVLKGIDLNVSGEEKLGICGRTGAGKSSLTLALFRIIEPVSGSIWIDSQDISQLGLHTLRSNLTIIPQDPVLFTGDLRFNLDPLGQYSDEELWKSLELAHLKGHVTENLTQGLDSSVSEGGSNFSVGQRQLICLARALLRKTKILILDEATAAIDQETDELIQKTIRTEFAKCTVLTIAHRLNTIMDYDKIAVLSNGQVEELGTPQSLLQLESSSFRKMAVDSNLAPSKISN